MTRTLPASLSSTINPVSFAMKLATVIRGRLTNRPSGGDDCLPMPVEAHHYPGCHSLTVEFQGQLYRVSIERECDVLADAIREGGEAV